MFSFTVRPIQSSARSVQVGPGLTGLTQRFASPRILNLRYSSHNKPHDATLLVVEQRLRRPVSPHLSIYRPQITWVPSMLTRLTGIALSGGLYLYSTAYLLSPMTGWDIGSESLVAAFSSLPPLAQIAVKFGIALPFVFHSFNGVRILVWDTGRLFTNRQVNWGGWMVVGTSGVFALLLALWKSDDDA
ncbi:Succinate dehydrogenase cytochrome b556 subunit [Penicillium pulvis]|uniref:Succinate dehydrogenase cytochrome b556 subunit n=1 Tax=Penicillium pulvis TaxID=1562058 RepID=UPI0025485A48|nr:Succinate dehydrogenase cytochrome b556 subunit [Penicillium pulvis]KAJ5792099.1 Succinate dehydrogenase cytochrome b556 subunit [Penicillium pulvis]